MANITHKWKRGMAWSCSHAVHADPDAMAAMMTFRDRWKPQFVACLGDFIDMTAFMGGGTGGGDVAPDIDAGLMHLKLMMPKDKNATYEVLLGNHEDRCDRMRKGEGVLAYASHKAYESIEECCAKLRARMTPYTGIWQKVMVEQSDILLTHGTWFNQTAAMSMAGHYCNGSTVRKVLFGHTHKVAVAASDTDHGGIGYNIGTLTARASMDYAKNRKSTAQWMQGFAYFEYCNALGSSSVNLLTRAPNEQWRLPL
jgi:predicted phosphodiesterase